MSDQKIVTFTCGSVGLILLILNRKNYRYFCAESNFVMSRGRIRKNLKFFRGENEKIASLFITRYIGINDGGTYRSSQKWC